MKSSTALPIIDVSATFVEGTYLGLKGAQIFRQDEEHAPSFASGYAGIPIITLSEDGKTAMGRWYGYGTICSMPVNDQIDPMFMSVVYEMEYIKKTVSENS